jgi:hypothetical protein
LVFDLTFKLLCVQLHRVIDTVWEVNTINTLLGSFDLLNLLVVLERCLVGFFRLFKNIALKNGLVSCDLMVPLVTVYPLERADRVLGHQEVHRVVIQDHFPE